MLAFAFEWNLFFTRNILRDISQSTCASSSLRIGMEQTLYLWRNSEERFAVDLRLVVLTDRDGADIVLVA